MKRKQFGFGHIGLLLIVVVMAVAGFAGWQVYKNHSNGKNYATSASLANSPALAKAVDAGKQLSDGHCTGTGTTSFTHLPMDASDFSLLIPYGQTVGGHVTPIDHQYFAPTVFNSPKDAYPVYAMADSQITHIEIHPPQNGSNGRIRLIFTVSCTFFYYYDLVTSVQPGIDQAHIPVPVKAGQLIGHIGGQTLDFAVWNTTKQLPGFVNPASYSGEPWKIYTDNPFSYYTPALSQIVRSKDPRSVEPIQGKIDYDIDGTLIGNWFVAGSGGYSGPSHGTNPNYSQNHLSIAPDLYDPSAIVISVGNYQNYPGVNPDTSIGDGSAARQYFAAPGSPDPAKIGVNDGAVKFGLVERSYLTDQGLFWNQTTYASGIKANTNGPFVGTVMAKLTGPGTLEFEVFKAKTPAQVSGFDSNAKYYTR